MHQRAALQTGKDGTVDGFLVLRFHQDETATWTAQTLVCGGSDDVGMRYRVWIDSGRNQTGVVCHIDHENGPHVFGYFGKALKINAQAVGRGTGDDELGFGLMGLALHGVVIDFLLIVQAVADDLEPLATHIKRHAVRQMAAFGQTHAHNGVAGLQEGEENSLIGRGTAVRLHVGAVSAKNLPDAVDGQLFGDIDKFAAAVIAFAWVAFCILVSELGALRRHDGGRGVVFTGDQFDMLFLARVFSLDGGKKLGVGLCYG